MQKGVEAILDQEVVLDEAQTNVIRNAALMKAALEGGNLREALKNASGMVTELKNTSLSPKFYFILCIFGDYGSVSGKGSKSAFRRYLLVVIYKHSGICDV